MVLSMPTKNKELQRVYQNKHYHSNTEYYKEKRAIRRAELLQRYNEFKSTLKCILCPEADVVTLDLHHFDPDTKDSLVREFVANGRSWSRIVREIEKCVCLCSNCHRKVHAYPEWAIKISVKDLIIVPAAFTL